jgi:hypothetical protein
VLEGGEAGRFRMSGLCDYRALDFDIYSCDTDTQRAIAWESQPEETA